MKEKTILEVPYPEKDEAKSLGARWDVSLKKWYVPKDKDLSKFFKWLPEDCNESDIYALAPIYLVKSWERCWQCSNIADVFCLGSEGAIAGDFTIREFVTFSNIAFMPEEISEILKNECSSYFRDLSKKANAYYQLNHCKCNAKLGDFYMHNEPGGAFMPINEYQAKELSIKKLTFIKASEIGLSASIAEQPFILEYAKNV